LTLAQLLEKKRPSSFGIGRNEYDPDNVGYKELDANAPDSQVFDTSKPGNSNEGHYYGVDLSPEDKSDLIDYLKTR
jgi:hypothetical protein